MNYKVIVVTTRSTCCSAAPSLKAEVETACNKLAAEGYVLVTAHPENVRECNNVKRAVFMIFARPEE